VQINQTTQRLSRLTLTLAFTLALGLLGGWVFRLLGIPLPWLLGAMTFTLPASLGGLPVWVPGPLRNGMVLILGLLVGSAFTSEMPGQFLRWLPTISMVVLFTALMVWGAYRMMRHLFGVPRLESLFAGIPGGLANVIFVASDMGADLRLISLVHSIRIVLVCLAVPLGIRLLEGELTLPAAATGVEMAALLNLNDLFWLTLAGSLGFLAARALRLPAPFLIGPLLLSAVIHMAGLSEASPPGVLVLAAQVVVGSSIGCRFAGVPPRRVAAFSSMGATMAVFMLAAAGLGAMAAHWLTGLPISLLLLAFAPGGLPEMTLISLALGMDVAFVVTHHLARVLLINLTLPLLCRRLLARGPVK